MPTTREVLIPKLKEQWNQVGTRIHERRKNRKSAGDDDSAVVPPAATWPDSDLSTALDVVRPVMSDAEFLNRLAVIQAAEAICREKRELLSRVQVRDSGELPTLSDDRRTAIEADVAQADVRELFSGLLKDAVEQLPVSSERAD